MKKILLVEDDTVLGETIVDILEDEDYYDITWVKDGKKALDESFEHRYDLYLFDINVPFINGLELLNDLRKSGDKTPAIFITAKVDIESFEKGFEVGADDYIRKPFHVRELLVRINKQIQKSFLSHNTQVHYKDISYNIESKIVTKDGNAEHLTPTELKILELFLKNTGRIISKDEILDFTHDGGLGSDSALRVQISRLKKLGLDITNIRAIGYRCEKP